jgi:hypothetical protein
MCARSVTGERLCTTDNPHNAARPTIRMRGTRENIGNRSPHYKDSVHAAAKSRSVANALAVPQPRATCPSNTSRLRHKNGAFQYIVKN